MSTPVDRRAAFIAEVTSDALPGLTAAQWRAKAEKMATEGPDLGRTERWRTACRFALDRIEEGLDPHWAVLQGAINMGHAGS